MFISFLGADNLSLVKACSRSLNTAIHLNTFSWVIRFPNCLGYLPFRSKGWDEICTKVFIVEKCCGRLPHNWWRVPTPIGSFLRYQPRKLMKMLPPPSKPWSKKEYIYQLHVFCKILHERRRLIGDKFSQVQFRIHNFPVINFPEPEI